MGTHGFGHRDCLYEKSKRVCKLLDGAVLIRYSSIPSTLHKTVNGTHESGISICVIYNQSSVNHSDIYPNGTPQKQMFLTNTIIAYYSKRYILR